MKVNCWQSETTLDLADAVFQAPYSEALVHQTVVSFLSSQRRDIARNKSRGDVRGHAAKPWRQKGTGRARHGSRKSPLWRGGGLAFASNRPNWQRKINRKAYRACLRSILSRLLEEKRLIVIDHCYEGEPRTRELLSWRRALGVNGSCLLVIEHLQKPEALVLASRNLQDFDVCNTLEVNPENLISFDNVLLTRAAAEQLGQSLQ